MTSRSIASLSSALIVLCLLAVPAWAGRKIVVLEFEGDKAEKFRDDVEDAISKSAKIVSLDKWLDKADDLDATKVNAKNIKKVARKLKVDGVVMGEVEKRGQRYYIHLKLREGLSGEYTAEVEIVVRSPKLGKDGAAVIKEELIPAIKELVSIAGDDDEDDEDADEDEEEDQPKKKKAKKKAKKVEDDEDEEDDEDDDRAARRKKGFGGGNDDEDADDEEDDEEDEPKAKKKKAKVEKKKKAKVEKKKKKKAKPEPEPEDDEDEDADAEAFEDEGDEDDEDDEDRVAEGDDDDDDDELDVRRGDDDDDDDDELEAGDPRQRALDLSAGMSVTARRLGFTTINGAGPVQGYRGNPVAGAVISGNVFPLAFNKKNKSLTKDFGLTFLFDRVVKISSKIKYDDMGMEETAVLGTVQQRFSFGAVFRYLIGDKASITASVRFNKMKFVIDKDAAPTGVVVQIPNVDYTFIDPGLAVKYIAAPKVVIDAAASVGLVLDTGEMQQADQFGTSKVLGIDFSGGVGYQLTDKFTLRGEVRATTFGFSFSGNGAMNDLDGDGTGDVPSGRDTYFGAMAGAGYIF